MQTDKPKISVIVPVYNTEKWLQRCIDSILAQTFTDFELLLIDDGSSDSSGAICDEYAEKDSRIRVFHKPNGGSSSTRNKGLKLAIGEWITFCDSDDWVYPEWLDNFNLNDSDKYDLICQGIECDRPIDKNVNESYPYTYSFDFEGNTIDALNSLYSNKIMGYTVIKAYRREIIKKQELNFDTRIKLQEDDVFLYQYLKFAKSVRIYDKIGYYYYLPNWEKKYKLPFGDREYFLQKSLKSISNLRATKFIIVEKWREIELSQLYYTEFCENPQNRKYCITQLRKLLKDDFKQSQIFYPTRLIIRFDKSGVIASAFLRLHLYIKNIFYTSRTYCNYLLANI